MSHYLLGQGKLYCAARAANGMPAASRWLGDVSDAKLSLKTETLAHKESYTGQASTAKKIIIGKDATFDFTLMELSKENLAMVLYGKSSTVDAGSVTAEALPAGLKAGDRVSLRYPKVAKVVITDSTAIPKIVGVDGYEVDPIYGAITVKNVTGLIQPLKVAYSHEAIDSVSMFSAVQKEIFIRYEGINLAEDGAPIIVELYKVSTEPLKELALINSKLAEMVISSSVLIDRMRPADDELGQFGRILQLATL